jgi:capsular polysaccharide biosynthesis protein
MPMDIVTILHRLFSHRRLLLIVALLAVLAGTAVMYKISFPPKLESRRYDVGIATDQILIDTPQSQLEAVSPRGTETISEQTLLLASLMVDGAIKSEIAQNAGLRPSQITGVNNAVTEPTASGPAPVKPPSGPRAYVLTTQVLTDNSGSDLPIIELTAQAPSSNSAARLATAAITSVRNYLGSIASEHSIPNSDRLNVGDLGVSQTTQVRGPSVAIAILVAILVFGLGCALILLVPALVRAWRAARELEKYGIDGPLAWEGTVALNEPFLRDAPALTNVRAIYVPAIAAGEDPPPETKEPSEAASEPR